MLRFINGWKTWQPCAYFVLFSNKSKEIVHVFKCQRCMFCLIAVVDGEWSDWSNWGTCSEECGAGTQQRMRRCNNPEPYNGGSDCDGISVETRDCECTSDFDAERKHFAVIGHVHKDTLRASEFNKQDCCKNLFSIGHIVQKQVINSIDPNQSIRCFTFTQVYCNLNYLF